MISLLPELGKVICHGRRGPLRAKPNIGKREVCACEGQSHARDLPRFGSDRLAEHEVGQPQSSRNFSIITTCS